MLSFFGKVNNEILVPQSFCGDQEKTMPLQVRCSPPRKKLWTNQPEKRVLPFTSGKSLSASMTVEVSLALPLFVFFVMALLMPMRALDTQRKLQTVIEMVGEDLSLYAYIKEAGETSDGAEFVSDAAAGAWLQKEAEKYSDSVGVTYVQVPDDNGDIILELASREKIPFFSGNMGVTGGLTLECSAKRRSWIGIPGKLRGEGNGAVTGEDEEEMVYVGNNMERYHIDKRCHYISNEYQAVSLDEAKSMRDPDGHRFAACSSCVEMIQNGGTVYVTPGGRHYHGDMECRAMIAYVRKVPLSEVEYLGPCSYCSQ